LHLGDEQKQKKLYLLLECNIDDKEKKCSWVKKIADETLK
jgi:hypothetical protein